MENQIPDDLFDYSSSSISPYRTEEDIIFNTTNVDQNMWSNPTDHTMRLNDIFISSFKNYGLENEKIKMEELEKIREDGCSASNCNTRNYQDRRNENGCVYCEVKVKDELEKLILSNNGNLE